MKLTLKHLETEQNNLPVAPVTMEDQRLNEAVTHILYLHDFMDIAYCFGEYYLEALDICSKLHRCKNVDEIPKLMDAVFSYWFIDWSEVKKTISRERMLQCSTAILDVYQQYLIESK